MTTFLTADEHYFHSNVIRYCDRPFKNETEMRHTLINNNNEVVGPDDQVFHLGDFAMIGPSQHEKISGILRKLNGKHHLILGNHDECKPFRYVNSGFISVHTALWVEEFVLVHDPSVYCACRHELGILAHGHLHQLYDMIQSKKVINVGVDVRNYYPVTLDQLRKELNDE